MRPSDSEDADGAGGPAGARGRARANLTGRAAMQALVVCMLAISLAYPLREYLEQRSEIRDYRAKVAAQEKRVAQLRRARDRWRDPAFVEAQARERLSYVMPGETAYVVLEADETPTPDGVVEPSVPEADHRPWFGDLWSSVEAAGKG